MDYPLDQQGSERDHRMTVKSSYYYKFGLLACQLSCERARRLVLSVALYR